MSMENVNDVLDEIHTCNNGEPCRMCDKTAWKTKEERDEFTIEQLKASIIADLHALQGQIGNEPTKDFVTKEFIEVLF